MIDRRAAPDRVDRWLLSPAPAERLAIFRLLIGLYAVIYLLVRLPAFLESAGRSSGFEPVGVLWFLDQPIPETVMVVLTVATTILAVLFAAGIRFRLIGPTFALALLLVTTYRSSWGRLLYFDNLLVLHVLIVSCTRAADAMVPAFVRGGRWTKDQAAEGQPRISRSPDAAYGWPLKLCGLVTIATYVLAGLIKLRIGGLDWLSGSSLRNHVAFSAARFKILGGTGSPLATVLMDQLWLFTPAAIATVVLELGSPAMLLPRLRNAWIFGLWLMHAAIAGSMFVLFPYPLLLLAFAPLFKLELLPSRVRALAAGRRRRRR